VTQPPTLAAAAAAAAAAASSPTTTSLSPSEQSASIILRRGLVNPANEQLQGTVLPYFPMAGPPPKELNTTNWGGMDAGPGMFYATQSVDGIVSMLGGAVLREKCSALPVNENEELHGGGGVATGGTGFVRCPVGAAVVTDAVGTDGLTEHYDAIIHAVPPLWPGCGGSTLDPEDARQMLQSCFAAAIRAGLADGCNIVTIPLLGAGARGAPVPVAIEAAAAAVAAAATASTNGGRDATPNQAAAVAELVVLEPSVAAGLVAAIDNQLTRLML